MKHYSRDTIINGVITIAVLVVIYLLFSRLSGVLLPFIVSWFIAYLMMPLVNFLQHKCHLKSRILSVIVALLLVLIVIGGILAAIIPLLINEVEALSADVQTYIANYDASSWWTPDMQAKYEELIGSLDVQTLLTNPDVIATAKSLLPKLWQWLSGGVSAIIGVFGLFICLLYIIFILFDYEQLSEQWVNLIPKRYRHGIQTLANDLETGMNAYFRGQALIAFIVGILFAIGFWIIGLPMGIAIGLFIGVLNLVPYLQTLGIPVCALLGILQSAQTGQPLWLIWLLIAVVFCVVQATQDMFLTPKIMGNVTGMRPAVILLSLSIWGSLLGIVGMIIALPITTIIISYYKRFVLNGERFVQEEANEETAVAETPQDESDTPSQPPVADTAAEPAADDNNTEK